MKERPNWEKFPSVFLLDTLKTALNEKFNSQMNTIKAFFPKIRALFTVFNK